MNITLKKKNKLSDILFAVCVGMAFCFLCTNLYLCFFDSVWCDEVFSLYIIRGSYLDILINTATDVHPPLYYFILKFFTDVLGGIFPTINIVMLDKLISFASIVILFYFMVFKLSKIIDKNIVAIALIMLFGVSAISDFAITVRMYGYALLFVLVCLYYLIRIIKFNTNKDWRRFVLFFELSALTHYFALIAVGGMFVYLLIFVIVNRKNEFWRFYKYLFCAILAFVPWLTVMCCQFAFISGNGFWITKPDSEGLISILDYAFNLDVFGGSGAIIAVFMLLVIVIYFGIFVLNCINKEIDKNEKWIAFSGMFVTLFLYAVGLFVSYVLTPIFVERYVNPIFACLCVSFAYNFYLFFKHSLLKFADKLNLNMSYKKAFKITIATAFVAIVAIYSAFNIVNVVKSEQTNNKYYEYNAKFFEKNKDAVLISDYGRVQSVFEYSYNVSISGLVGEDVSWWENVTHLKHETVTPDSLKEKLESGKTVLFLHSSVDMVIFDKHQIKYQLTDTLYTESNDIIGVYKLELGA